jgi:hypothetical protein
MMSLTHFEASLAEVPEVTAAWEWLEENETNDLKNSLEPESILILAESNSTLWGYSPMGFVHWAAFVVCCCWLVEFTEDGN